MDVHEINWHCIEKLWNGAAALHTEVVRVGLSVTPDDLIIHVDAPFHSDPPPVGPPCGLQRGPSGVTSSPPGPSPPSGRTDRLWEYEVVEVFLLGDGDRYLELEVAPGRYLFYEFEGRRLRIADDVPEVDWSTELEPAVTDGAPARWSARLAVPRSRLPPGSLRWNAFACHGQGPARRLLALHPSDLDRPDFHALGFYAPLP